MESLNIEVKNIYSYTSLDRVIWDTESVLAIENEIDRLNCNKVFIVSSSTLSRKTSEILKIRKGLGDKFVGLFDKQVVQVASSSAVLSAQNLSQASCTQILASRQ